MNPKQHFKDLCRILKRVNSGKVSDVTSDSSDFTLYEKLRRGGLIDCKSVERIGSGGQQTHTTYSDFVPTIDGLKFQFQADQDSLLSRTRVFLTGVVVSAVISIITYSSSRYVWEKFIQPKLTTPVTTDTKPAVPTR